MSKVPNFSQSVISPKFYDLWKVLLKLKFKLTILLIKSLKVRMILYRL